MQGRGKDTHQRRQIVARLATEFVLVAESQDVLDVRDEVVRVCMQNHIDEKGNEGISRGVGLFGVFQESKNNLTTVQDANDFIPRCSVAIYL